MSTIIVSEGLLESVPLEMISNWEQLQTFSADLLKIKEGEVIDSREYLRKGAKQDGIDVYATVSNNDRYIAIQCKREKYLSPKDIDGIVDEFLSESFAVKTFKFIICTTADLKGRNHEEKIETARRKLQERNIRLQIWDQEGINRELRLNPNESLIALVIRYFSVEIAQILYGSLYSDYIKSWRKVAKHTYPFQEDYVNRRLVAHNDYYKRNEFSYRYYEEGAHLKSLSEIVRGTNSETGSRLVILSMGGFGKTFELRQLAAQYCDSKEFFFPILHSLSDYSGQPIDQILSLHNVDWSFIPEQSLLLILDGLDEIKPPFFDSFIRELNLFADAKPKVNIVASSRFNFYDVTINPLRGFDVFLLEEFNSRDIDHYLRLTISEREGLFKEKVGRSDLAEYLHNPYYLVRLVRFFKEGATVFPTTKSEFFDRILFERIDEETKRYGVTEDRSDLMHMIQKVAFCMTLTGESALSEDTLALIVPEASDREKLRRYFLMNLHSNEKHRWSFEHKNLQEYLCALSLRQLPFETLIKTITFQLDIKRVQPKFLNTLSFLFSMYHKNEPVLKQLLNWLLDNEPDVLIRFEKNRISRQTRLDILKALFGYYKAKSLFFYSSVLPIEKVADFVEIDEQAIGFLEQELFNEDTSDRLAYDIIALIERCRTPWVFRDQIERVLFKVLLENKRNDGVLADAIDALRHMEFTDEVVFRRVFDTQINMKSFRVRHAIVFFLLGRSYSSKYLEFIIESVPIYIEGQKGVKYGLADNNLVQIMTEAATDRSIEVLLYFIERNGNYLDYHHKSEHFQIDAKAFSKILEKAARAYRDIPRVLKLVYRIFRRLEDVTSDKTWFPIFKEFFQSTCGGEAIFHKLYRYNRRSWDAAYFANNECCDYLIREYKSGRITDEEMRMWRSWMPRGNGSIHEYLYTRLKTEFGTRFLYNDEGIDYVAIRAEYEVKNHAMIADKALFFDEVRKVYDLSGKDVLIASNLYDHKHAKLQAYSCSLAYDIVARLTRQRPRTFEDITQCFASDLQWEWFKMRRIKELLGKENTRLSSELNEFATNWCKAKIENLDFTNAVSGLGTDIHINSEVLFVQQVFCMLDFELDDSLLLKMLASAFDLDGYEEGKNTLASIIVKRIRDKNRLRETVLSNIKSGNLAFLVLLNHYSICAQLGFTECLGHLYRTIEAIRDSPSYNLSRLTEFYLQLGGEIQHFKQFITMPEPSADPHITYTQWNWFLIGKTVAVDPLFVRKIMIEVMQDVEQTDQNRTEACRLLFQVGEIKALVYWRDHVLTKKDLLFDLRSSPVLQCARMPRDEPIKILISMLETVYANGIHLILKRFDSIEDILYGALRELAMSSEDRFMKIVTDLDSLYGRHPKDDYATSLTLNIERIKQDFFAKHQFNFATTQALMLYNEFFK